MSNLGLSKMNKVQLLKKALTSYTYSIKELGIFSNSYFKKIIYPSYSEKMDTDFSVIYGDFDKLGQINLEHGMEAGDQALKEGLKIMKEKMPEDTIISRVGGDEFIIITHTKGEKTKEIIENVHNELAKQENMQKTYGISITLEGVDSTEEKDLNHMILKSECKVNNKKEHYKGIEKNSTKAVTNNIIHNADNYFRALKAYDFPTLDEAFLRKRVNQTAIITKKVIDKYTKEELKPEKINNLEYSYINLKDDTFSPQTANLIHKLMTNDTANLEETSKLFSDPNMHSEIVKLFYELSLDSNTRQLSRIYFENVLLKKFDALIQNYGIKYNTVYIHTSGLKISNTLKGHAKTDERLKDLATVIENTFERDIRNKKTKGIALDKEGNKIKNEFFNKTPLTFSTTDNFLIDLRGGDFVIIIPEDSHSYSGINNENIIEIVNDKIKDIKTTFNDDLLSIKTSIKSTPKPEKNKPDDKKITIKDTILLGKQECHNNNFNTYANIDDKVRERIFEGYIEKIVEFYMRNTDNCKDPFKLSELHTKITDLFRKQYKNNTKPKNQMQSHEER